jgi:hypothetical protein
MLQWHFADELQVRGQIWLRNAKVFDSTRAGALTRWRE